MGRSPHLFDAAVLAVVGVVVGVGVGVRADGDSRPLALALGLGAAAALVARRRAPVVALAISGGLVLALFAFDPAAGAAAVLAPAVALYSLVFTRGRIYQIGAALASAGAVIAAERLAGHTITFQTVAHVTLVAVPLLAAEWLRTRRAYIRLLLERLEISERTREEEGRHRVEQERLRIARELHDVVAHTLTTINVQSGVARHLLDRDRQHTRAALSTIEDASRDALDELRAIVGVLRERTSVAPLEPAPTLEDIGRLIERSRSAGVEVSFAIRGDPPQHLSDAVELAAFRIVQESLTNVRRHAPGAATHVSLSFETEWLQIAIENAVAKTPNGAGVTTNGRTPGVGIIGMRERAEAIGGRLDAAPCPSGFRVTARLPYRRGE